MVFGAYCVPARAKMLELSHWFSGAAKMIIDDIDAHSLWDDADSAYAVVRSELESLFGHTSDTVASLIESIKEGCQLEENDFKAHMDIYGELKAAHATAVRAGEADDFDRRPHLRGIIECRLSYMSKKFWSKFEKRLTREKRGLHFADLLDMIMRQMKVLKVRGAAAAKT